MATGLSSTVANAILNAYGRNVAWTQPAAFWVKLHTADPGSAGTTAAATETTRKQATFSAASGGSMTTSADLAWTNVAGTETITHVSFWDASTAGTFIGSDDLNASKALTAGDNFTISTGTLTLTLTPLAA